MRRSIRLTVTVRGDAGRREWRGEEGPGGEEWKGLGRGCKGMGTRRGWGPSPSALAQRHNSLPGYSQSYRRSSTITGISDPGLGREPGADKST
eukprot:2234203-Rhodomonas_salina.3